MDATTGRALDGDAHLRQSISDILSTPLGSRIERREYGSNVPFMVHAPGNGQQLVRLYAAAATALIRWEPRVRLTRITMAELTADGRAALDIEGQRADATTFAARTAIGGQA